MNVLFGVALFAHRVGALDTKGFELEAHLPCSRVLLLGPVKMECGEGDNRNRNFQIRDGMPQPYGSRLGEGMHWHDCAHSPHICQCHAPHDALPLPNAV